MEEASEQKSLEEQNNKSEKPSYVGTLGGAILLTLPIVGLAAIIGLFKGLEFLGDLKQDSKQNEVDSI